ncbi:MAG: hypothetical protein ACE5JX_10335 [Acidobacteriota bacterium]
MQRSEEIDSISFPPADPSKFPDVGTHAEEQEHRIEQASQQKLVRYGSYFGSVCPPYPLPGKLNRSVSARPNPDGHSLTFVVQ